MKDPLTLTYEKLWEMYESHKGFTELVKVNNRGRLLAWKRGIAKKLLLLPGDRPYTTILTQGGIPQPNITSSTSLHTQRYQIVVVTDTLAVNDLYPITWEILRASLLWTTVLLDELVYDGSNFVVDAGIKDYEELPVDNANKGIHGWVGRLGFHVRMKFQTSAIRPTI